MNFFYHTLILILAYSCQSTKVNSDKKINQTKWLDKGEIEPSKDWKHLFHSIPNDSERLEIVESLNNRHSEKTIDDLLSTARKKVALGRFVDAEKTYRSLLRRDPNNLAATLEISMIYIKRHDKKDAFLYLNAAKNLLDDLHSVPEDVLFQFKYTYALAHIEFNNRSKGHEILSEIISKNKYFSPAYAALASSYIQQSKFEVATFILNRGLDHNGDDPSFYNLKGVISESNASFEKALVWYDKALEISPNFAPALINKAIIALKTLDYNQAEALLKKGLSIQKDNIEALSALSQVYMKKDQDNLAKAALENAIKIDFSNPSLRYNLGVLYLFKLKKPHEALRLFNEVLQSTDSKNDHVRQLAKTYISDIKHSNYLKN